MTYRVKLYTEKSMPYIITDIEADNESDAIYKSKKLVAENGYNPGMSTEEIMNALIVESVTIDMERKVEFSIMSISGEIYPCGTFTTEEEAKYIIATRAEKPENFKVVSREVLYGKWK